MSKLTKKECIEALKELSRLRCLAKEEYDREEHAIIMLEHLIKEHFELKEKVDSIQDLLDNKPYEFEELNEGMWVWDDKTKEYKQVDYTTIIKETNERYVYWKDPSYIFSYDFATCKDDFNPNRFYPREVKDNEHM